MRTTRMPSTYARPRLLRTLARTRASDIAAYLLSMAKWRDVRSGRRRVSRAEQSRRFLSVTLSLERPRLPLQPLGPHRPKRLARMAQDAEHVLHRLRQWRLSA